MCTNCVTWRILFIRGNQRICTLVPRPTFVQYVRWQFLTSARPMAYYGPFTKTVIAGQRQEGVIPGAHATQILSTVI